MKLLQAMGVGLLACAAGRLAAEDFLDRVGDALSFAAFGDRLRARLSGRLDLEGYFLPQPPPGLIDTKANLLFNPRLTFFIDAQLGPRVYLFTQARVDRGFDPDSDGAHARLDEYALRLTPWTDGRLSFQVGKFATVVGNWLPRHLAWENPFVTAPLPYENRTGIDPDGTSSSPRAMLAGLLHERYEHLPVIWGPSYTTGASVAGAIGHFDYAAEVKNAALGSSPETWDATEVGFDHPTVSARLGFRPNPMWNLGLSASGGAYLLPAARRALPEGRGVGDYRELVLGQDIGFAWHHWQVWAEFYQARFEVPRLGSADTFAYYLETKYKFSPRWFGALRWNQQFFATLPDTAGGRAAWGHDLWRGDAALGYRFTAHTQLKLQYSLQHENSGSHDFGHLVAGQFTLRF